MSLFEFAWIFRFWFFECPDILWDSIRHPSKRLLPLDLAWIFCFEFPASRDITKLNQTSDSKENVVWICSAPSFLISSVPIYYRIQLDIRVKSYCCLNLLRASVFHFEQLDILRDSIRHLSDKLLSFEFAQSFGIPFRETRYITGLNQTSE